MAFPGEPIILSRQMHQPLHRPEYSRHYLADILLEAPLSAAHVAHPDVFSRQVGISSLLCIAFDICVFANPKRTRWP